MRNFFTSIGVVHSFAKRDDYLARMKLFQDVLCFPWRKDQKDVIDSFLRQEHSHYVVNGIFGCGKTTMLLGIHVHAIIKGLYKPADAMFFSYNVCIKNELIQKLRRFGMGAKTDVRTFDSLIYEICKLYDYPYMDLPNYEGKRKFVYKICKEISCGEKKRSDLSVSPRYIFIDECQDLEHQTFIVFQTFFPKTQVIFAGDVFQSIQKEPRESLLWYLLHTSDLGETISRHYMKETPRVPHKMLENVKDSLKNYYPEFHEEIDQWRSSSGEMESQIEWHRFYNYSDVYKKMDEFLEKYDPAKSMILTFSSAITVKGAMGDLARIRRYLVNKGYDLNHNHKKMDHEKLFLSTVNSSKGLERDHVFIVSTFPLERAFVNFSNDLVINLLTVGVTRSKKSVVFYVPAYGDKFSTTLSNFAACPAPNRDKIREGKTVDEFVYSDYLHMEHSVTELLKQSIIKYDTRIRLRESTKKFDTTFLFDERIPYPAISTEEERAFVGVLLENLVTSSWTMKWPPIGDIEMLRTHPMYTHCFKKIESCLAKYSSYVKEKECTGTSHFQGIYYYTQIHLGMFNKIFIELSTSTREYLSSYWGSVKSKLSSIRPSEGKISIQSNMRMPWVTGIADALVTTSDAGDEKKEEVTIWEMKASTDANWKDDALTQAMLYAIMTGKLWARLVLLNPFRNEKVSYYFNMKNVMELRDMVINDVVAWNNNCWMCKNIKVKGKTLRVTNELLLAITRNIDGSIRQYSLFQFMSPTKMDVIRNGFIVDKKTTYNKRAEMTALQKLCKDSVETEEEAIVMINDLLASPAYRDAKVYYYDDNDDNDNNPILPGSDRLICMNDLTGDINEITSEMGLDNKEKTEKIQSEELSDSKDKTKNIRKYNADIQNSFIKAMAYSGYLSREYKFV